VAFIISFTVDVIHEEVIPELTSVVHDFVEPDSKEQERFVNELQFELESRNDPVPTELRSLQPRNANSEVWLRGSFYFDDQGEEDSGNWIVGAWVACEGSCGTSMQSRTVECSREDLMCAGIGRKPPSFRECKHPSPCPSRTQACMFGCGLQWWVVVIASVLICMCGCTCICRGKIKRACGKRSVSKKDGAKTPVRDINAYVKGFKAQATHSSAPDVNAKNTEAEAPTLLRSVSQEQVKSAPLTVPASVLSVADVELRDDGEVTDIESGDPGKVSCNTESEGAVTNDLAQWLTNLDMKAVNLKIPAIPASEEPEAGNSAV